MKTEAGEVGIDDTGVIALILCQLVVGKVGIGDGGKQGE